MHDIPKRVKLSEQVSNIFGCRLQGDDMKLKLKNIENNIETIGINASVNCITDVLVDALPKSSCVVKRKSKPNSNIKKWYDSDCRAMKSAVNCANRKLSKVPWDVASRENFFFLRKQYKKLLKFKEKKFKEDLISKINDHNVKETKHFWEIVDELKSLSCKTNNKNVTQFVPGDVWYDHFNKLLAKKESDEEVISSDSIRKYSEEMMSNNGCIILNEDIKFDEISKALRSPKNGKSCGLDMVTNEMLKVSKKSCIDVYCKLFNRILQSGEFPETWTQSVIVPLHKAGNCHDPNNYRGLAINSCFGKLFTTVLNKRFKKFIQKNDIIVKQQIGFTEKSQTIDHMLVIKTLADKYKHEGKKLYLAFVDFQKAYDTVWREGMFFKLLKSGINGKFFNVIKSMYRDSETCVKIGGKRTAFFKNNVGVKQGEVMSPILFNLYINDIAEHLTDADSPELNGNKIDCLLYADDLVMVSTSEEGLQKKLNSLEKYCAKWRLRINESKTMVMQVSKCGRLPPKTFKINDVELTNTKTYKYLGIVFDSAGNFNQARINMNERGQKAMYKLKSAVDRSILNSAVAINLFDKTVKPVCLYGAEIWGNFSTIKDTSPCKLIEKLYSKLPIKKTNLSFMKWILGVHRKTSNFAVLGDLGRYPFLVDVILNTIKYYLRLRDKRKSRSLINDCLVQADVIDSEGGNSWLTWIKLVLKCFASETGEINLKFVLDNIKKTFRSLWNERIVSNNKLRTFAEFKCHFQREDYIETLPFTDRCNMARFRMSAHNLEIERGRHFRPVIPLDNRLCRLCTQADIEDEFHVLIRCDNYRTFREQLFNEIQKKCSNFSHLNDRNKFLYLLTCDGEILKKVGQFVKYILNVHSAPKRSS